MTPAGMALQSVAQMDSLPWKAMLTPHVLNMRAYGAAMGQASHGGGMLFLAFYFEVRLTSPR